MINLREFWQAAMANLRAIFSARPARPSAALRGRPTMLALPGPVASGQRTAHPPRHNDGASTSAPITASPPHEAADAAASLPGASHADTPQADAADPPAQEEETPAAATSPTMPPATSAAIPTEIDDTMSDVDHVALDDDDETAADAADITPAAPAAEIEPPDSVDPAGEAHTEDQVHTEDEPHTDSAPPAAAPSQTHGAMPPVAAELEALLFVAAEPTAPADLARALGLTPEEAETALGQLADFYQQQGRGLRLQRFNGKVQLVTAPGAASSIERFLDLDSTSRLSSPALETLAVIAYRQPVTRAQIESVRGVDCAGVLRSLLQRGLVAEVGRVDGPGRPILYGVTEHFMQHFGLTALDELPPLEEDEADRLWAATLLAEDEELDAEPAEERDG